jgi:type II secretory pathway pseudopilin PulG
MCSKPTSLCGISGTLLLEQSENHAVSAAEEKTSSRALRNCQVITSLAIPTPRSPLRKAALDPGDMRWPPVSCYTEDSSSRICLYIPSMRSAIFSSV